MGMIAIFFEPTWSSKQIYALKPARNRNQQLRPDIYFHSSLQPEL